MLFTVTALLMAFSCGNDTSGPSESIPIYFPMETGDYWTWDYSSIEDREGTQNDSTELGERTWLVEGIVDHDGGFSLYQITLTDSIVTFFNSIPVDTLLSETTEYYRLENSEVRYYYSLSDTTSWLLLDLPLALGKSWNDVENAEYTVLSMDTTLALPYGTADGCAWVQSDYGISLLPTYDNWYYEPGIGTVKRVYHQENDVSYYLSTWQLTSSSRL